MYIGITKWMKTIEWINNWHAMQINKFILLKTYKDAIITIIQNF